MKGLGNDILEINRLRKAVDLHGQNLLDRLFTKAEQDYCKRRRDSIPHFAGRFAAKEAIVKALGCGFGAQVAWKDIEIRGGAKGRPEVHLSGSLKKKFQDPMIFLSISHSKEHATAVAIWI